MSDTAIRVKDVGKQYRIGQSVSYKTIRESMMTMLAAPLRLLGAKGDQAELNDTIWALRQVNFEIKRGDVVGIIGRNGAGKSTLLKILSRITEPTEGELETYGRVGSLLEVGTGFHPELTGRENIFLNGAILGMTRREIKAKFNQITEFAEIDQFLDTPVKRYSSGMRIRLGFSVAAHLQPEILIVDEVLAVGDVAFQKKCLEKMNGIANSGRTVVFVSHNMAAVENLCHRTIVLDAGRVVADTDVAQGVQAYLQSLNPADGSGDLSKAPRQARLVPVIHGVDIVNNEGENIHAIQTNDSCTFLIHYRLQGPQSALAFGLHFENHTGTLLFRLGSWTQDGPWVDLPATGTIACRIERVPLLPGNYFVTPFCGTGEQRVDEINRAIELQVVEGDIYKTGKMPRGKRFLISVDAEWNVLQNKVGN